MTSCNIIFIITIPSTGKWLISSIFNVSNPLDLASSITNYSYLINYNGNQYINYSDNKYDVTGGQTTTMSLSRIGFMSAGATLRVSFVINNARTGAFVTQSLNTLCMQRII